VYITVVKINPYFKIFGAFLRLLQRFIIRFAHAQIHAHTRPFLKVATETTTHIEHAVTFSSDMHDEFTLLFIMKAAQVRWSLLFHDVINLHNFKSLRSILKVMNRIDGIMSLDQDFTTVPGQLFACMSIVGPTTPQKTDKFGIKIRGAFSTRDEAGRHAKRLQKEDATFDIYVVDMYKWLLIPPDPSMIEDSHYNDEKLEELMSGYKENQAMAAKMFGERKRDMATTTVDGKPVFDKAGDDNSRFYNRPDEAPITHPSEIIERLKREKPDAPMEELVIEANAMVAVEVEERRKKREADMVIAEDEEEGEGSGEKEKSKGKEEEVI
jgi:hypothetical protein